jgi:hypothetical protein
MNRHLLLLSVFSGLSTLSACDRVLQHRSGTPAPEAAGPVQEEPVTGAAAALDLPVRPQAEASGAAIDWEAARRDLAMRSSEDMEGSFQIQSGGDAPPVPIFLPSSPVMVQGGESTVRFQPTDDGYYAFFPGEAYDIIVNGTNVVINAPGEATQTRTDAYTFQTTTTGANVSFSRYGADYLVEYECKALVRGVPECITEEEAISFARDLAISGTR